MSEALTELRLDLCLYNLRFCKTRALAQELIEKGRVRINGEKTHKSARKVHVGDCLVFPAHGEIFAIEILGLPPKRVGAAIAQTQFQSIENEIIGT